MPFEVTPDIQAWVNGGRSNYGWAILPWPNGGDGWAVPMPESVNERERPQLRIYYTANAVTTIQITSITRGASTATVQFTGPASSSFTVLRSTSVNGTYSSIGTASSDGTGHASFTD